ncbi:MAG: hypothetical protein A2919_01415 [Candidatus Spechtbacteria bacterium RIFCSPLOWO2_01_FULL_43_12]|uniref:DUF4399 domain-containing protein n=1 Tax=Candidatus Spechtbacteria bacterium RIFCSPLOWO2_01_FULL_43_12 TaxID=1802162 RepID=A0A1G2HFJ2_9BACT|nr:MAG: hypothetical protein A2919_01415 [Candidatus Spechtbacteria bacterium RIFCSPLOWO2_01_FULL_43_12]
MYKRKFILFLFVLSYFFVCSYVKAQEVQPEIKIVSPTLDQRFEEGEEITVEFEVNNFTFVDFKSNTEPFPGNSNAGHAHLWVVDEKSTIEDLEHDSARKILSTTPIKLSPMEEGRYKIVMELTQNHHVAYGPPARAEVSFRVGDPPVSISVSKFWLLGFILVLLAIAAGWLYIRKEEK